MTSVGAGDIRTEAVDDHSGGSVAERYDALFLDLDGVIYRGDRAVPGAREALAAVQRGGIRRLFLSNNSARTAAEVAAKLQSMGVDAEPSEVLTSALATASWLVRERLIPTTAFVIGERGIREALAGAGVEVLDGAPDRVDLVVVGWDRTVDFQKLRIAALLVERGARLIATNADASYPAPDGLWPGAGAILAAVTTATGVTATIVGKPERPMFEAAAERTGARRPLVVGDRLDTDVRGAASMEWDSALVLTGAATPRDLVSSADTPTYVGPDLALLLTSRPAARFRRAGLRDIPSLRSLLESAGLSAQGLEGRIEDTVLSAEGESGSPDATASLEVVGEDQSPAGILRSVAVRPGVRGQGLGMLAAHAAVTQARNRAVSTVALFTVSAEPFFERLGFRPVERAALPASVRRSVHATEQCPDSATAMLLEL